MSHQKLHHEKVFNIAWGDMDALGHVNNVKFFDYFQEARIEWLATLDLDLKQNEGPILLKIGCTFLKPVVYPATLTLKSQAKDPGRTSIVIDHRIFQEGALVAEGSSKIVWVDYLKNKPIPLPDVIRTLF